MLLRSTARLFKNRSCLIKRLDCQIKTRNFLSQSNHLMWQLGWKILNRTGVLRGLIQREPTANGLKMKQACQQTWLASVSNWQSWMHCSSLILRTEPRSSRSISRSWRYSRRTWTRVWPLYWLSDIRLIPELSKCWKGEWKVYFMHKKFENQST